MGIRDTGKVYILAASRKDAENTCGLLSDFHIACEVAETMNGLVSKIDETAGALVIAKEALCPTSIDVLADALHHQPKWSSIPVILLLSAGDLSSSLALEILKPIPNVTMLERPIRQRVLVSVIQSALSDRRRQYELRDSLNEALEANRAKSEFLANMSHEIRTPLGAVLGFSELLANPNLPENERQLYLNTIRRNGQLLTALINDILDLAKVEAGRLQIEKLETSVSEILSEVVTSLEPRAASKGVELKVEKDPKLPDLILTDPVRLKQILLNIAGNAVKFTAQGSVSISATTENGQNENADKRYLVFRVTDTGIGIKPEQASLLFQSFSQADSSITRKFGGTGLGLVLSQRLARALGGDLKLTHSTFGKGSTFEIAIELEPAFATERKPKPSTYDSFDRLHGLKVLIVDDSKDNLLLLNRFLNSVGISPLTADNGHEGIEVALNEAPDVVLMDVQMPVMSGLDATRELRKRGFKSPIIALTAHALKGDRDKCMLAGCNDYLTKPVGKMDLFLAVDRATRPARQSPVIETRPANPT